ncbi:Wzz/FepE/Etk N-terminal domain-containing protein [Roseateles sp. LKC17W]|uniref:Wzz/FepE/Etk N-terminal domain-containing protein n=1 Tax=Pelomonas margarita TaxID=3299031 RepID=A0ABW7FK32_9BURK
MSEQSKGAQAPGFDPHAAWRAIRSDWKFILSTGLATGLVGYGLSHLIPPTYTARTTFISPQQQQNTAAAALASLGALSGLTGAATGIKSPADQYVALMKSVTLSDRIIEQFALSKVYDSKYMMDARKELGDNVRITAGRKDNLISIDVDDHDPERAAAMANAYVTELRKLTNGLAVTEAQQRRMFFQQQMEGTRDQMVTAQVRLQETGFTAGALKNEPKAAAEIYARTKAEVSATEIRLAALRQRLANSAPEVQQALSALSALRGQLTQMELPGTSSGNQDYVSAYRDYKYREALFEIFSRQFELAKTDEAREGTLIQVLDVATPPEKRSKPKRSSLAMLAMMVGIVGAVTRAVFRLR